MLPKTLTRLIVNQHCSVGERGMIDFDLGNLTSVFQGFLQALYMIRSPNTLIHSRITTLVMWCRLEIPLQ